MFNIENIAECINNYEIINDKVFTKENHEEITNEELILKVKAARMIYDEVLIQFRIDKNENMIEFEQAITGLANIINGMTFNNPKGDIISAILTSREHLSRILTLNAKTKEEAIEEINRQNLSESLLFQPKYNNTLSLLKLKFRESNLDIDNLEVNLEPTETNTWELTVDYKVIEYQKEEQLTRDQTEAVDDLDKFEREENGRSRTLKLKDLQEQQNALRSYESLLENAKRSKDDRSIENLSDRIEETKEKITEIIEEMQFETPTLENNNEKETENRIKLEELYSNELPMKDGIFIFQEFEDYLRDYKYEEGTVYERKNSEEVTDEEIILKMKAIYLVDALARQEIKEKMNGYDPVVLPENIINHYLHIFSEEFIENNDINNIINAILNSEGHFEYTTDDINRTDKTIEEDIKNQKGLQSVLALFINPIRDCTEAIIALIQRKKGIIQESINTLIEEVNGKIKLTVDYFIRKPENNIEPNPEADIMSVELVRIYCENFEILNDQIYSKRNHELITDENLILNIRIAHLIYKYACLSIPDYDEAKNIEDDIIQETIAKFSMYSNDKISSLLKILVYGALEQEEFSHYEYTAFNLNSNNNMFDEMEVMDGLGLYDELNIFNEENLENTKALLTVLFKKMGLNMEEFNVRFEPSENQAMKLVFDYKIVDLNKKDQEENQKMNISQVRLFSIEDIKYYAKNYIRNNYGELCWRETGEVETNEEIIVPVLAAKFINNIVRNLKESNESYNYNSREENLSIAYDKVLNNYVINDILNNVNHVEYLVNSNERNEEIEFVFDPRNKSLFEYYIRDQFRNLGYDVENIKMYCVAVEEDVVRYSIDYQIIKLGQNLESEEEYEDATDIINCVLFLRKKYF